MSQRRAAHDLERLVLSFHSLIAVETVEEERLRAIVGEAATELRLPLYEWSLTTGLRRALHFTYEHTDEPLAALRYLADHVTDDAVFLFKDIAPHLTNAGVTRALRELAQRLMHSRSAIVLTGDPLELPRELDAYAARFQLPLPDAEELRLCVRQVLDTIGARQKVQVDLTRADAQRLIAALTGLTLHQARRLIAQAIIEDNRLSAVDIDRIQRWKAELLERGSVLELFPAEQNRHQLGGFSRLKRWLDQARTGFTREARAINLPPPRGVLLTGVQGCGKSLAAKFVAAEWQLPLLKLDAGRLYDKYVGESEKNFRRATGVAEAMAPVVLWIDEIEKAFAQGGSNDADGGLSQRIFGAFLTWMQEKKEGVFVVAAANDVMRLPPELLRKGRFDEVFFVDLPAADERAEIVTIHLRLRKQEVERFDLARITAATDGFSGAELEQAIVSSLYRALHERVPLTTELLLDAVRSTTPLSVARREDVAGLRAFADGRFQRV